MPEEQGSLHFGPVSNLGLFSNHWLTHRLHREPDWDEQQAPAAQAFQQIREIWNVQRNRVERYGDEQGLEEAFIQPVLRALGWKLKYQSYLQGREPDYALFLDDASLDAALAAGRNEAGFWLHPVALADAKAWHVSLDRPIRVGARREYPPEQIEWYLDRSRLDFAILTNGRLWRLIPRQHGPHQRRFQTYLEVDLPRVLDEAIGEDFTVFYSFFGPAGFRETADRAPLLRRALQGSSEYRLGVGESLKERTFEALRLCIEGFLNHGPNSLHSEWDLELCRDQSFIFLYRLLFIMYAEDRGLLPYKVNRTYTNNRSLGRHRDEIAARLDRIRSGSRDDYARAATALWDDLQDLFDLVDSGHRTYGVPAYNGGLFSRDENSFLNEKKLPDWHLSRVIDQLGRAADPQTPELGLSRVDYHDLAIQHLGGIYEGMLELQPRWTNERMIVVSRRVQGRVDERYIRASEAVPSGYTATDREYPPHSIYLQTRKGERRQTGSYYTPDHIVDYIVQNTLGRLCQKIDQQLNAEIAAANAGGDAAAVNRLRGEFDRRVLALRVLDPAMGSGHFLLRACQYLAEEIATNPHTAVDAEAADENATANLAVFKRQVVEKCLFGVDMNGLAVELAKLALWLETVSANQPLSFLDHHLRHGNSLVGARLDQLGALPGAAPLRAAAFAGGALQAMPRLLDLLDQIRRQPSDSARQVKDKERLFRRFEQAREPFRHLAELWCSKYAEAGPGGLTDEQYQQAVELVGNAARFRELANEPWFKEARDRAQRPDFRCFTWELEFPEVFFAGQERHPNPGFDAVIGNPPYDVLSELENETDLSALKAVIAADAVYASSIRGKNNLYKLFVCKSLSLLAPGGYLGFITPMAVLGDDQAADLRRRMVELGSFRAIEAFPQKDNPAKRIFPEAKLSTAVFVLQRHTSAPLQEVPFRAQVHPGRTIEAASPGLTLTTAAIPLYDPSNFTIVSCDQADWDLAVRIMGSGRMGRFGDYAVSYQGEVNETNDRQAGRISYQAQDGPEVIRGAHVCLYALREASQGTPVFLFVDRFLNRRMSDDAKALHHRHERVGFQRKSPQNNFRRLIAARIPTGTFLLESVSYVPAHNSQVPLDLILALLNSKLCDWYFRIGSTNAMVGEYQFNNLPCPVFAQSLSPAYQRAQDQALGALESRDFGRVLTVLQPLLGEPPFSLAIQAVLIEAVKQIQRLEAERGDIARVQRSRLAEAAQPYQDLIDRLLYKMAGLSDAEAARLEERLARML